MRSQYRTTVERRVSAAFWRLACRPIERKRWKFSLNALGRDVRNSGGCLKRGILLRTGDSGGFDAGGRRGARGCSASSQRLLFEGWIRAIVQNFDFLGCKELDRHTSGVNPHHHSFSGQSALELRNEGTLRRVRQHSVARRFIEQNRSTNIPRASPNTK